MGAIWQADSDAEVTTIASETPEETLENTADWESNYARLVVDYRIRPSRSLSLNLVVASRRFAKLYDHVTQNPDFIPVVEAQLGEDVAKWQTLAGKDGGAGRHVTILSDPRVKSDDLIIPLTYRINSSILLLAKSTSIGTLDVLLRAGDEMGSMVNRSALGYALDRILMNGGSGVEQPEARALLAQYGPFRLSPKLEGEIKPRTSVPIRWQLECANPYLKRAALTVPESSCPCRPFERQLIMMARGIPEGYRTIEIDLPPIGHEYDMFHPETGRPQTREAISLDGWYRKIVDYARRVHRANSEGNQ